MKTNKGQITMEILLIALVLAVITRIGLIGLRNSEGVKRFSSAPKEVLKNMMSHGNWIKDPARSRQNHPEAHSSHYSYEPHQ